MVLTQNGLLKSISDTRQRKINQKLGRIVSDCPYGICDWTNDPTEWPELSFPDTYCYLIESPGKRQLTTSLYGTACESKHLSICFA